MTRWQRRQWKQTWVAAAAVGAVMGACLGLVSFAFYFNQGRAIALGHGPTSWTMYAMRAVELFLGSIAGCVLFAAVLPALCHAALARLMRAWNPHD